MSIIEVILILIIILFFANRFLPAKGVTNITAEEVKPKLKDKNSQFIDVRTPGEYQTHHRKPFINIPLSSLSKGAVDLDREKETIVICQSGMRSLKAAKVLKKMGFQKIYNVKGGMGALR